MVKKLEQAIDNEFRKQLQEMQKPNIAVVGATGVGKSAIINRIFGEHVAKEGVGKPLTQGLDKYEPEDSPIVLYDTEGYEVSKGDTTNFDENIMPKFEEMNQGELKDHLHLAWYCISMQNHRITKYDTELIRNFADKNIKTCVVFTRCDKDEVLNDGSGEPKGKTAEAIKRAINKIPGMDKLQIFETCATNPKLEFDLEELIEWSMDQLPNEALRASFAAAQISSIPAKKKRAYKIMMAAAAAAAGTGAVPIPMADAPFITAEQIAMCMGITKVFWRSTNFAESVIDILKTQIMSIAGKTIVSSLTKLIPVLGSVISAATAGILTGALGTAMIEIHARSLKQYLDTGQAPDWKNIFGYDAFVTAIREAMKSRPWEKQS